MIEAWVKHLLHVDVEVEPLTECARRQSHLVRGARRGGDQDRDLLWNGEALDEATAVAWRTLSVHSRSQRRRPGGARESVYLILATSGDKVLRMKPQNLVTGLPIRHLEAVT